MGEHTFWKKARYFLKRKVDWPIVDLFILGLITLGVVVLYARIAPAPPSFGWDALANSIADFVVGILIAGFVAWHIARSKKAVASMVAIASPVYDASVRLDVAIRNIGRISFRSDEIYWHLFVSTKLEVDFAGLSITSNQQVPPRETVLISGEGFNHYGGRCNGPVFHGQDNTLYEVRLALTFVGRRAQ